MRSRVFLCEISLVSRAAYRPEGLGTMPFRGSEAVARGLISRHQLAGFTRLYRGICINPDVELDHLMWCAAAHLAVPSGVLGFRSALGLQCPALRPGPEEPVDIIVPLLKRVSRQGRLNVHHSDLTRTDCCKRSGFWVTNGARTAYDLGRTSGLVEAVVCIDALLHARCAKVEGIAGYISLGGRGSLKAAQALELADGKSESPMESRTRIWLLQAGLPTPEVQYEVRLGGGVVVRLDLAYPEYRVAIEYDGDYHREKEVFCRDATRANLLLAAGWKVFRFTAADAARDGERIVAQVRAALQAV
jgi:very-short-patch-repair endonuclease